MASTQNPVQSVDSAQQTMKAVFWEGKVGHMAVRSIPRPTILEPTDAIIRITTAAICGSDLHDFHGVLGGDNVPYPMGHEAIGIIHAVGSHVKKFKAGDRVVVADAFPLEGKDPIYGEGDLFGITLGGCQAEYVRAPLADASLFAVPTGTQHELDYLLVSDIFCTAWQSITGTGFQAGDVVAVYGCGPVGLLAAYSALKRGALRVYSIDQVDSRLGKAKSIGAIPIDLRKGDPSSQILALEPAGVRRAADCVGFEGANPSGKTEEGYILNDIMKVTAPGGGVSITGVYWHGPRNRGEPLQGRKFAHVPFDVSLWWAKGITINGGIVLPGPIAPMLIDMITAGRVSPGFVVDHHISIDDAQDAYEQFSEHKIQKAVIQFAKGDEARALYGGFVAD